MSKLVFSYLILTCYIGLAQFTYSGKIIDVDKKEAVAFASVGSLQQKTAVLTDEQGNFKLDLKNSISNDSIKFYAIGYTELVLPIHELKQAGNTIELKAVGIELGEVNVDAKKLYHKKIGVTKYDKQNCSGFMDVENNWKGLETAIRLPNKDHKLFIIKDFSFYVIKNTISDSLTFRLNFYSSNDFYPTKNILKRSIIFKTVIKNGEYTLPLLDYNIKAYNDFYVSLECLMDKVSIANFCFAGEITEPSYVRDNAINKWKKIKGGGAAFNVTVLYSKKD